MQIVYHSTRISSSILLLILPCMVMASTDTSLAPIHPFITLDNRNDIKVVYDVKDDVWEAGVGKALFFVRGLLESYKSMGIKADKLNISVILHGPTAYWLLNEAAYQIHKSDPFDYNPNEKIVGELLALGVSVEICNATMKAKKWTDKDLLPSVIVVHDAFTRLIDLQSRQYAYIRF